MLNLYDADGKIQFDKDREAAHQYFCSMSIRTRSSSDEKLDYLIRESSVRFSTSTRATSSRSLLDRAYAKVPVSDVFGCVWAYHTSQC